MWMERQVRESNFVLIVCTEVYLKRAQGKEEPGKGHGVIWESVLTYQQLYDAGSNNEKFIPVLLQGGERPHIPDPLKPATSYRCTTDEEYEQLYRRLTNQHEIDKPALGKLRPLPAREVKQHFDPPRSVDAPVPPTPALADRPTLWQVPHDRNPVFTGRIDVLEALRNDLLKNGWQALHGLGGIGKTQIAVEYVYRHRQEYSAVFWAFAESEQALITSFIQMAKVINLPVMDLANQTVIVGAVKLWLEQNEGWLLVFDNADPPGVVRQFLPSQCKGHILLTSRAHDFQVLFQTLSIIKAFEVIELPPQAARQLLLKRTARERDPDPDGGVDAVTEELGYFPLALEQAGAFIYENQTSFENYLRSFRKRRLELLERRLPVMGGYKGTVATTWAMNFAEVEKSPASADLLRLSAFLAPAMIPLELLERGSAELGDLLTSKLEAVAEDPVVLDELFRPLTDYSLIRRNLAARAYSIHPLVQEVVRANMGAAPQRSWAERTVRAISATFPDPEFPLWSDCERLLSHALLSGKYVIDYNFEFEAAGTLLRNAGFYLHQRGRYHEARPLYEKALAIREKACGQEHPHTADSLNKMAWLDDDEGQYFKAELLCKRALEINEKALGAEHPASMTSLSDLGKIYSDQGKSQEAESLYTRALAIRERVLGPQHSDTATSLNNLAALYHDQGRLEEAEALHKRALRISESVLGPEHPHTAASMNNLAGIYQDQERYGEAEPLLQRALAINEKVLGSEHPNTARALHNLGSLYKQQRRYEEAQPLFERALKIKERILGSAHPDFATTMASLASIYGNEGKFKLAEPLFLRAYAIREKALGLEHPDTINVLENLATLYRRWGRVREANRYNKTLKQIQRRKRK
jgi:tetratricopeptide (TPR) repeat protein